MPPPPPPPPPSHSIIAQLLRRAGLVQRLEGIGVRDARADEAASNAPQRVPRRDILLF